MDVNAITLENRKKRKRASSITPNKVIIKLSSLQEGDTGEAIGKITIDVNKHVATSSFVNKVVKIVVEEGQNLKDVDTKKILKVEMLHEKVVIILWSRNHLH
jgi:hypothetical protein